MSGFLRRLASQALGQTEGVRPAPQPWLFPASLPPEIDVQADPPSSGSSLRSLLTDESPPAPTAEAAEGESAELHARRSAPAADQAIAVQTASPRRTISPRVVRGERDALARGQAAEPLRSAAKRAPAGAPREPRRGPAIADRPHVEPSAHSAEPDRHTQPSGPMRRSAQDLRQSEPRASRIGLPLRLAAQRAPDVHIHIGRVELTALTPPTPPRRQSPPAKKATSLEDYLRARNGRAP